MDEQPADFRILRSEVGWHLFLSDGSRLYDLPADYPMGSDDLTRLASQLGSSDARYIDGTPLAPPPLQTLSLNVAQACNMGCGYCYAGEGSFGKSARKMRMETAMAAVDRLMLESRPAADLTVGFMGGEPFLNRSILHAVMPYADRMARTAGKKVRFSLTTNATLLQPGDVELLQRYNTHVAISLDGPGEVNDLVRPMKNGSGSYHRVRAALDLFAAHGRPRHLSARVTVTPRSKNLVDTLEHMFELGFDSVGFSPVLVSPNPGHAFSTDDFTWFSQQMIECGQRTRDAILARRRYPFSNFETALQQIDRGTHRPYPCGGGAAYLSVNADGDLFTCHRLVDDDDHHLGDVWRGSDVAARADHLTMRHVDRQEPCRSCWARYLCGGGCYHEVERRGRVGCDYIRTWLEFCLVSYAEMRDRAPSYFENPDEYFDGSSRA